MSDTRRLENELRSLREQQRRSEAEMDRMRGALEREQRRTLEAQRNELRRGLEANDATARRKYEALLREYQRGVDKDVLDAKLAMDAEYRKLLDASKEAERQWNERARQMEEEARKFKREAAARERVGSDEAGRAIDLAAKMYAWVEGTPHEFFSPNRLGVFFEAIREAVNLHKTGLNEAAAAISLSTRGGLERFGYDVRDKRDEWMNLFSLFKARAGLLHLKLQDELLSWIRFTDGVDVKKIGGLDPKEKFSRAVEVNFWSRGVYAAIRQRVDEFGMRIAEIEKTGVELYLKNGEDRGGPMNMETLKACAAEIDRMNDSLNEVCDLYKARYGASCQRARWGEEIARFLSDEINLTWLEEESGYRGFEDAVNSPGEKKAFDDYVKLQYGGGNVTEDVREWLELVFENSAGTRVFVYIVPEERKPEVLNRVLLYVHGGTGDYALEIYRHLLESLDVAEEEGVVTLLREITQLTLSPDATFKSTGKALERKLRG